MEKIRNFLRKRLGYARMFEMKQAGIHPRVISDMLKKGEVERIKPGFYKLREYPWDENSSFLDICMAEKRAVICLLSAASYYELILHNPPEVSIAVPQNTDRISIEYPPVKIFYFSGMHYSSGIDIVKNTGSSFRIYCKEKTVVDLFRYRNRLGEDLAIEALKEFFRQDGRKRIPELMKYAHQGRVMKVIEPIIKGIL